MPKNIPTHTNQPPNVGRVKNRKLPKLLIAGVLTVALVATTAVANALTDGGLLRTLSEVVGIQPLAAGCDGTLCVTSVERAWGSSDGGESILITGTGFPDSSHTTDYVTNGLVVQYDAIDNTGLGDDMHSKTVTDWKNLHPGDRVGTSGANLEIPSARLCGNTAFDCTRSTPSSSGQVSWTDNSYHFNNNTANWINVPANISYDDMTIEIVYAPTSALSGRTDWVNTSFDYNGAVGFQVVSGRDASPVGCQNANQLGFTVAASILSPSTSTCQVITTGEISTLATRFASSSSARGTIPAGTHLGMYKNGVGSDSINYASKQADFVHPCVTDDASPSSKCFLAVFGDANGAEGNSTVDAAGLGNTLKNGDIYSFRIYSRPLQVSEMAQNYNVDHQRFIAPPVVKVGGQTCTNLTVISGTQIKCTTPAKASAAAAIADVTVDYQSKHAVKSAGYEYKQIAISSVSPGVGLKAGGSTVYINGQNFPSVSTNDYVQDGLIIHYDGINNTGFGDAYHDNNTLKWANLHPGNSTMPDAVLCQSKEYACSSTKNGKLQFNTNSAVFNANVTGDGNPGDWIKVDHEVNYPNYTMEYAFQTSQTPTSRIDWASTNISTGGLFLVSGRHATGGTNCNTNENDYLSIIEMRQTYRTSTASNVGANSGCRRLQINQIQTITARSTIIPADNPANNQTRLGMYINGNGQDAVLSNGYVGTVSGGKTGDGGCGPNGEGSSQCFMSIGGDANDGFGGDASVFRNGNIYGFRLYDRPLSIEEIMKNNQLDIIRFREPPVVKIDGKECTSVVVLSANQLSCTVPSNTGTGKKTVSFDYGNTHLTMANGYEYAADGSTVINGVSPKMGPQFAAGQKLVISGSTLSKVTGVTVAGASCPILTSAPDARTETQIKCTVPALPNGQSVGPKDVSISITGVANPQVLVSAFEYLDATDDPVKYRMKRNGSAGAYNYTFAEAEGNSGLTIEPSWTGITRVVLTYPTGLTAPAATTPPAGWTKSTSTSGGNTILTLTANTYQTYAAVEQMLKSITFNATADTVGNVKVQLVNGLW